MYKLFTSLLIFFCSIICFGQHPNNLQSTNITSSSVELSWDDSSCSAATWLRFREAGTSSWTPSSAPYISIYDGDTILSGLQPGTQYQWRVKCAGTSGWSNIEGFTTLSGCNITTTTSITNTLCDNFFDKIEGFIPVIKYKADKPNKISFLFLPEKDNDIELILGRLYIF